MSSPVSYPIFYVNIKPTKNVFKEIEQVICKPAITVTCLQDMYCSNCMVYYELLWIFIKVQHKETMLLFSDDITVIWSSHHAFCEERGFFSEMHDAYYPFRNELLLFKCLHFDTKNYFQECWFEGC